MLSVFVLCIYCLVDLCLYYLILSPPSLRSHGQELCSIYLCVTTSGTLWLLKYIYTEMTAPNCLLFNSFLLTFVFSQKLCNVQRLHKPSLVQNSYTIKICFKEVYSKQHWLNDLAYFFLYLNSEVIPVFWVKSKVHYSPKLFSKLRINSCYHFENTKLF